MRFATISVGLALCLALLVGSPMAGAAIYRAFREIVIVPGPSQTETEARYIELLEARLSVREAIQVSVQTSAPTDGGQRLTILIGVPERHPELDKALWDARITVPDERNPGEEGFLLRSFPDGAGVTVWAAAVDTRGVLYAAGKILRHIEDEGDALEFPIDLEVRTAPAFEIRGTQIGQGHTMQELTGARDWTEEERRSVFLDYALAGANTFVGEFDFVKSYGLKAMGHVATNAGTGPPEWQALEAIGRVNYLCPSVPEARQHMLDQLESRMQREPAWDYLMFSSGDGGGCECDKCAPYGATYIRLVKDMAEIVHRYHPDTKIFATNQKLDSAGDLAIFEFLRENPGDWLAAICYAPGSNAMSWQPGRRQDHRMDLFRYPAFGERDRYLREILHELQPDTDIVFFTGVTHWIYQMYSLISYDIYPDQDYETPPHWSDHIYSKRPDSTLMRVYNRRTFHARPRDYYDVFRETMRYSLGDVTYSEGYHDHFNNWMWQRLLWNPHHDLDSLVAEYARIHFGRGAAPEMAQAIFQLEENLTATLESNDGVDRMLTLVRQAGRKMPVHLRETSALWRQYMQRALLDKYFQLKRRLQLDLEARVMSVLARGLKADEPGPAVEQVAAWLDEDVETDEMRTILAEAGRLGEESEALFGVRSEAYFSANRDLVDFGWLRRMVHEAQLADASRQREILDLIVNYEDPGEGGYYDDAGNPDKSPNLVYGFPRTGYPGENRPSQASAVYTTTEPQGVTFEYRNLDPGAEYRIRFTLARPRARQAPGRVPRHHPQSKQSIYADGHLLVKDLELPVGTPEFFEFDIPKEATQDGLLKVWFEPEDALGLDEWPRSRVTVWTVSGGWGTLVSEAWLMKKSD